MKKKNIIAYIVFLAVVLFSTPLWVEAESLDDEVKRLELEIKKKELEQKLRKMKESESGTQFAPPPPPGNPLDPSFYNPGQMPQAGGRSQLRGQQGIDDGLYSGMSGQAQQSYENCQQRLQRISLPQNPNGRTVSFWLEAKNEQTAQYGFTGPGAACVPVTHKKIANTIYGYFLVIYRGGLELEFPDFKKMIQGKTGADASSQSLGDVGSWDSILLQNVWVQHFTITDPAPSVVIQNKRNNRNP